MTPNSIEAIASKMVSQNKRHTAYPIFIVVEDQKIYGVESGWRDGVERKDGEDLEDAGTCEACLKLHEEGKEMPEECDDCDSDGFIGYRIEKHVPNMRAGFFFTAEACDAHIMANRHHYNSTAKSYAISAYHNEELKSVMVHLVGPYNESQLR